MLYLQNSGNIAGSSQLCFFIGSTNTNSNLPVKLRSFNAEKKEKHVTLKWETDSKIDNDHFEIERSIKGLGTFESIGTVRGNGTTESKDRYQFIDAKLNAFVNEIVCYRLKQVDVQGTFE